MTMKKVNDGTEKISQLEFCNAYLLKSDSVLYTFKMTFDLCGKKIKCIMEHGNLFGIENEIESFSHWHLN